MFFRCRFSFYRSISMFFFYLSSCLVVLYFYLSTCLPFLSFYLSCLSTNHVFFPSLKHCQKKLGPSWTNYCALVCYSLEFFPTCQVRVVRWVWVKIRYPNNWMVNTKLDQHLWSPRSSILTHIQILSELLSSSSSPSCSSSSPPPPVSPRPCLHQLPPQLPPCQLFANFPTSQLSAHRWTSTWELPSSLCQLSVRRWTSTWDLPSSVCTAGPQPGTFPALCAPLDLNGQTECQKICQIECQIECQKICQIKCDEICQRECQKICQIKC